MVFLTFFRYQGGEMLYARGVKIAKDVVYPQNHPSSSHATRSHPGKERSYKPKALNETMLPIRRKKSFG